VTLDFGRNESEASDVVRGVRQALATGKHVTDLAFDTAYPPDVRAVSAQYWTPYAVARRAAELLVVSPSTLVLDVGSGAGKLCVVGAATTGARFVGVEHRPSLVRVARRAAEALGVMGARFIPAPIQAIRWTAFDAFYLFNPFGENAFAADEQLDTTVELGRARYVRDVAFVERMLARVRVGVRVLTYHGFGGTMPDTFQRIVCERAGCDALELWLKTRSSSSVRH
jgi:predicted RNA methylase